MPGLRPFLCALALAFPVLSPLSAPAFDPPSPTVDIQVSRNDFLINICKKYLEDPEDWTEVARFNRLGDANVLSPGQVLRIPVEKLRGEAMPATVRSVSGEVLIRGAKGEWRAAAAGDSLTPGTSIRTGRDSSLHAGFSDGTTFTVRPASELTIRAAKKGLLHAIRRMVLKAGKIVSDIRSATGTASRYEVETPSSLAASRGTGFRIAADPAGVTRVEVTESTVEVAGTGGSVAVGEGEATVVRPDAPPLPPKKLLPPPLLPAEPAVFRSLPVTVTPGGVAAASAYRVAVSRDEAGNELLAEQTVKAGETASFPLFPEGKAYARASAVDADGIEGISSSPLAIRLRTHPAPPVIDSPVQGTRIRSTPPPFAWRPVAGAASYEVEVAEDEAFARVAAASAVPAPPFQPSELPGGTWHVRVRSVAGDGFRGDWSEARMVRVVPSPPPPHLSPATLGKETLTVTWNDAGAGARYQVQVAEESGFLRPRWDGIVDEPRLSLPKPGEGRYHVRVRVIEPDGTAGEFTPPMPVDVVPGRFPYELLGVLGVLVLLVL